MNVKKVVLREQIRDLIITRIIEGQYAPGARIIESQLAHELGVSQAPVREALRDAEAMRFVQSEPYKGVRVQSVALEELAEMYPVRSALEYTAAKLAVAHSPDDELDALVTELSADLELMRSAARTGDKKAQLTADSEFHRRVVLASRNGVLLELWSSLRIEASSLMSVVRARTDMVAIVETHAPLIAALATRDPEVAGLAFQKHIEYFGDIVNELTAAPVDVGT